MKKGLFRMRVLGLGVALTALSAVPAHAAPSPPPSPVPGLTPVAKPAPGPVVTASPSVEWSGLSTAIDLSQCYEPAFSQPFASYHDNNEYALAPGQTPGDFDGAGWYLAGGAKVVTATLANGTVGEVLDVPYGATAVSPPMCVTSAYPTARAMVRNVAGGAGAQMGVDSTETTTWGNPIQTGAVNAPGKTWGASGVINIHPGNWVGWQEARFAFV